MATLVLVILCFSGEAFLLYCLFHFVQEGRRVRRPPNTTRARRVPQGREPAPSQLAGSLSTAVWHNGGWRLQISDASRISSHGRSTAVKE